LDWHPDHQVAWPIVRSALKGSGLCPPKIRGYEVWTPIAQFDEVQNITAVMPRKVRALRAHRSQIDDFDYERAMLELNQDRGALAAKSRYAEAFQILRPELTFDIEIVRVTIGRIRHIDVRLKRWKK